MLGGSETKESCKRTETEAEAEPVLQFQHAQKFRTHFLLTQRQHLLHRST